MRRASVEAWARRGLVCASVVLWCSMPPGVASVEFSTPSGTPPYSQPLDWSEGEGDWDTSASWSTPAPAWGYDDQDPASAWASQPPAEELPPAPTPTDGGQDGGAVVAVGRAKLTIGAGLWGALAGSGVSAATAQQPVIGVAVGIVMGAILSHVRGNLGELVRALAAALWLTVQRWHTLKQQYPLLTQTAALLTRRRRRFPPNAPANLWRYSLSPPERTVDFSMARALLAAGVLGVLLGRGIAQAANSFFLPDWLLMPAFGGSLVFASTSETGHGDLVRCAAMKCVGMVGLVASSAAETRVPSKTLRVAGNVGARLSAFDERYHVKDRVFAASGWMIAKVTGGEPPRPEPMGPGLDAEGYGAPPAPTRRRRSSKTRRARSGNRTSRRKRRPSSYDGQPKPPPPPVEHNRYDYGYDYDPAYGQEDSPYGGGAGEEYWR